MSSASSGVVRKCLKCHCRFPEDFPEGYACGNAFTFFGTLSNPTWPCPKAYCRPCADLESRKQNKFVFEQCCGTCLEDMTKGAPTWCQDCAPALLKNCHCCQQSFCSECEEDGFDTAKMGQPYGFLCYHCGRLMMDKDEVLRNVYYPPGKILLEKDWYPSQEMCDSVDKLYLEVRNPQKPASTNVVCDGCGRPPYLKGGKPVPLRKCTHCWLVSYHNAECQGNHWKDHKSICRAAAKKRAQKAG